MNVVGMIVEYNPFHNGHLWHLNEAKRISGAQFAIGIMSGNFLQRGEPAIADKWSRAAMAVQAGADLIIELPTVFSVRSAQYFAAGGIQLLSRLGVVSHVCFGTETPDLSLLASVANCLNKQGVIDRMRQQMKTGQTYAASLAAALSTESGVASSLIQTPNNLLAIEYLRAITAYAPQLKPLPIQRLGANYHDNQVTSTIASATAVRTALLENSMLSPSSMVWKSLPPVCASQINNLVSIGRVPVALQAFSNMILAKIRTMSLDELAALPEVTEGLHNRISDAALKATTVQELLFYSKSKRYTLTRLQRIIIYALLGITKDKLTQFDQLGPLYARVLAFNRNGRKLLKEISQQATVPVITKTAQFLTSKQRQHSNLPPLQAMLAYDIVTTDIYVLGSPNYQWRSGGQDYQASPHYIPD
ncbi:tRNA(Met) cytidine acetate ligase [Sporomusa silvacetica DSM 10669]|uniref:tRNA(Met) cytidine acetate ligase n=1 Tax=Sporomusa silvacetica DSM 10669 TaxID=1123289 RepID=A0ABZ3IK41_9FIRM|nr:nucleotidyltransferase [Sporomusa silvacetica]OZC17599.1 hypothetical protein SPSIL_31670 [Sporomusa silvacetica DSM 10669]